MSKHNTNNIVKVMKQLKKCPDITAIQQTKKGYMIQAKCGAQHLIHQGSNCYHPLRRWCKTFTSLKKLTF
jgi:hypothetical protein